MFFKMRSAYFVAAISTVLTVAAVASAKYSVTAPEILVHAKAPLFAIEGVSNTLKFGEDEKNLTFKTFLNTIDTKNGKRNDHMQERFQAAKYNDIVLTVPKDQVNLTKGGTVDGKLKFHGVTGDVKVNYRVEGKRVKSEFTFDVSDFGIKKKDICFDPAEKICADNKVTINVNFDVKVKD